MRTSRLLLAAALLLYAPAPARARGADSREDSIRRVIRDYLEAGESESVEKMKRVLHPQARLFWEASQGAVVVQSPSELYARFRSNARYPGYARHVARRQPRNLKIEKIDEMTGTAAVRLELSSPGSDTKIVEQLLLMELADGWKIVSRVSVVLTELRSVKKVR